MPTQPVVGASNEVLTHHANEHWRICPDSEITEPVEMSCPCGDSVALGCGACDELMYLAVRPGTWCVHADEVRRVGRL